MLDRRVKTSLLAIAGDLLLVGVKFAAAMVTNSAALLADAFHSVSDLIVSVVLLAGLVTRARQECRGTAAGLVFAYRVEAGLAVVVSLLILWFPVEILRDLDADGAQPIDNVWAGILAVLFCIAVASFMARLKATVGEETDSLALQADGQHSQLDVLSSIAVLASLVGLMVGIDIDVPVAIVIAVLVAGVGVELLLAGIRGFTKGQQLEQQSLWQVLLGFTPTRIVLLTVTRWLRRVMRPRPLALLAGGGCVVYVLSGLQAVPPGHQGLRETLFQIGAEPVGPGLHYVAPAPFGRLHLVDTGRVHTIALGGAGPVADMKVAVEEAPMAGVWNTVRLGAEDPPPAVLMAGIATADENLVEVRFVVQYRLPVDAARLLDEAQAGPLVAAMAQHAVTRVVASRGMAALLDTGLAALSGEAQHGLNLALEAAELPIQALDLRLITLQPPAPVVEAYREVADAEQKRLEMQRKAEATRVIDLARAAAEEVALLQAAQAQAVERLLAAEGEAAAVAILAGMHLEHPTLLRLHRRLDTLKEALEDRPVQIVDPALAPADLRAWSALTP